MTEMSDLTLSLGETRFIRQLEAARNKAGLPLYYGLQAERYTDALYVTFWMAEPQMNGLVAVVSSLTLSNYQRIKVALLTYADERRDRECEIAVRETGDGSIGHFYWLMGIAVNGKVDDAARRLYIADSDAFGIPLVELI